MSNENKEDQRPPNTPHSGEKLPISYLDPIVVIALVILTGTFFLIGYSMFRDDSGILGRMAEASFARGLITYLFAVVTIGTAVVLVVYSLTGSISEVEKEKFQHAKEILSLLLGVFGTIVGFYFGSELAGSALKSDNELILTVPLLDRSEVMSGEILTVTANIRGGTPPYLYGISIGRTSSVKFTDVARNDGWIVTEVDAPKVDRDTVTVLTLGVLDANNKSALESAEVSVHPVPDK